METSKLSSHWSLHPHAIYSMEIPLMNVCDSVNLVYNTLIFVDRAGGEENPFRPSNPVLTSEG